MRVARKAWELAMAVTHKGKDKDKKDEGRMLLVADSDFLSDGVIGAMLKALKQAMARIEALELKVEELSHAGG